MKKCKCDLYENQVCNICQKITGKEKDILKLPQMKYIFMGILVLIILVQTIAISELRKTIKIHKNIVETCSEILMK